jgi:hypothetical protein
MKTALITLSALAALTMSACSSETLYLSGQSWQRNECNKLVDVQDRQRCIQKVDKPYDAYKQEAEGAKK